MPLAARDLTEKLSVIISPPRTRSPGMFSILIRDKTTKRLRGVAWVYNYRVIYLSVLRNHARATRYLKKEEKKRKKNNRSRLIFQRANPVTLFALYLIQITDVKRQCDK